MKKIFIFVAAAVLGLTSCSTDEIETFDGHDYLSFEKSTLTYTFAFSGDEVTTADFELPVTYAGRFSQLDRQFTIIPVADKSTAKEGTDFQLLSADEQVIKAGMNNGKGKIRLIRSTTLKDEDLTLVLAIAQNEYFLPGVIDTLTVTIGDRIMQPDWWDWSYNSWLGNYTKTKLVLWLEFMGVTDGSNPFDAEEYIIWTDRGTGNFIYKEYRESATKPKVSEFRQWLIRVKGDPIDPDYNMPVSQMLGTNY